MALGLRGYGYGKKIDLPFDRALEEVEKLLHSLDFEMKEMLDVSAFFSRHFQEEHPQYKIFTIFHPDFVKSMLEIEPSLGVIIPCQVILYYVEENRTGVSVMDPISQIRLTAKSMRTVEQGMALKEATADLDRKLRSFMRSLDQWKRTEV